MRLILDTNEFVFGFDPHSGQQHSIRLIEVVTRLVDTQDDFRLFIPEIIRAEVQRNLTESTLGLFYQFAKSSSKVIFGWLYEVPASFFDKYTLLGLKPADALVAAFADWQHVDVLISENRHIYERLQVDEFITCTAEEFLRLLDSGELERALVDLHARRAP